MSDPSARLDVSATSTGWEVRGELDAHTAPTLEAAMKELPAGVVTVDVAGVSFMDSSGLRVLLEAATRAAEASGDLVIVHSTPGIARLVEISGLGGQLRLDD